MVVLTPKEYFMKCLILESRKQEYESEYKYLEATLVSATKYSSQPPGSSIGNPTEDIAIKLSERKDKVFQAIVEVNRYKDQVSEELDAMENPIHSRVLRERYIVGTNFGEIAKLMNYTKRRIYQLHGSALLEFEKLYPEHFI